MTVKKEIVVRYRAQTYDIPLSGAGGGQDRMEDTLAVHYVPVLQHGGDTDRTTEISERPGFRVPSEWTDGVQIESAYLIPSTNNSGVSTGAYAEVTVRSYDGVGGAGVVVAREEARASYGATGGTQGYTGMTPKPFDYVATGPSAIISAGGVISVEQAQMPGGTGATMPPYSVELKLREI